MKKKIELNKGGAAYLLGVLLPNIIGSIILGVIAVVISIKTGADANEVLASDPVTFASLVITQLLMLFAVLLSTNFGKDFKEGCNLKLPEKKLDFLFAAIIAVGVIMGLTFTTELFFEFLGLFGYTPTESPFPDFTVTQNFISGIFIVAMLPAFCEEMLFRGVIMNSLKSKGKWTAILLSALFFMLMHASPLQTVYQFVLGVIMAIVAYKSRSVITTMFIHFLNNLIVVVLEFAGLGDLEMTWYMTVIGLVMLAVGLVYFIEKPDETVEKREQSQRLAEDDRLNEMLLGEIKRSEKTDVVLAILFYGIASCFCLIVWIVQFVQGLNI